MGLSDDEIENLILGKATLKYNVKNISNETREMYDSLLAKLVNCNEIEEVKIIIRDDKSLIKKIDFLDFCDYINIEIKSKDSIENLIDKIYEYIKNKKEYVLSYIDNKKDKELILQEISYKLEEFNDIEEANMYLLNSSNLLTKSDLLKLAKSLNVYIEKENTHEAISRKIVDSVVGAKLRSFTLRGKFKVKQE
jgi:hypothetical protein